MCRRRVRPQAPLKQKEMDQVMAMLLPSDEEEKQPNEEGSEMKACIKDYTKMQQGTAGMVAKEWRYPKLS